MDPEVLERWAQLAVKRKRGKLPGDDNDLWIAATALARDVPLVTSDGDHLAYEGNGLEIIHLAPKAT
jgi:predicted nucleic acid-binding protein